MRWREGHAVPLVDVTYDSTVPEDALRKLGELLPALVCEAVDCTEEPCIGAVSIGDMEIRFRAKDALDVGELNCVIEVRTKLFASRERDKQRRADLIRGRIAADIELGAFGVWLVLAEGAWSQSP
jgi:hypothetical protein